MYVIFKTITVVKKMTSKFENFISENVVWTSIKINKNADKNVDNLFN